MTGSPMTELGSEGIVEAFDGLGQRRGLRLVAVLFLERLAVSERTLIAAGTDIGRGVIGIVGVFLEDGIDVEDELAYSGDGKLTALAVGDDFGLFFGEGQYGIDVSLDGFFLCAQYAQGF